MAQLERADRYLLDGTLDAADIDVFAFAEGVIEQEKRAGKDVAHQRLRAEPDRQANNTRTGKKRADVDTQLHQRNQGDGHNDHQQDHAAEQRQQGGQAAGAVGPAFVAQFGLVQVVALFFSDLGVDPDAEGMKDDVPDEDNDRDIQEPV